MEIFNIYIIISIGTSEEIKKKQLWNCIIFRFELEFSFKLRTVRSIIITRSRLYLNVNKLHAHAQNRYLTRGKIIMRILWYFNVNKLCSNPEGIWLWVIITIQIPLIGIDVSKLMINYGKIDETVVAYIKAICVQD